MIDRGAKWVTLSPQVRAALAIPDDAPAELTPADVIRWLLQAPADLLWNGGIGTYVKATDEGHTEVGDRANDQVRVNGNQVRARVVGEGGNLGFTQRGGSSTRAPAAASTRTSSTTRPAWTPPTAR